MRLCLPKVATPKVRYVFGSSHILGTSHYGPTSHTLKKCDNILLGMPTCGSRFEELTLWQVWQHCMAKCGTPRSRTKHPFLVAVWPRIAYLVIQYNACCYVASDILDMALVNLPINGLQIYSVKCLIR